MGLVNDRLMQRPVGWPVSGPVEMRVVDHRLEDVRRAVLDIDGGRVLQVVAVAGRVPVDVAVDRARVRIKQQLARVAADSLIGRVWTVDPIAVALAGPDVRQVRMPGECVDFLQPDPSLFTSVVEQAKVDRFGDLRKKSEVRAGPVVRRPEWIRMAWPGLDTVGAHARRSIASETISAMAAMNSGRVLNEAVRRSLRARSRANAWASTSMS